MKLIEEWTKAYKLFSIQAMTLAAAILTTWGILPDDLKAALPHWLVPVVSVIVLALGIAGRLIDQTPKTQPDGQP